MIHLWFNSARFSVFFIGTLVAIGFYGCSSSKKAATSGSDAQNGSCTEPRHFDRKNLDAFLGKSYRLCEQLRDAKDLLRKTNAILTDPSGPMGWAEKEIKKDAANVSGSPVEVLRSRIAETLPAIGTLLPQLAEAVIQVPEITASAPGALSDAHSLGMFETSSATGSVDDAKLNLMNMGQEFPKVIDGLKQSSAGLMSIMSKIEKSEPLTTPTVAASVKAASDGSSDSLHPVVEKNTAAAPVDSDKIVRSASVMHTEIDGAKILDLVQKISDDLKQQIEMEAKERQKDKAMIVSRLDALTNRKYDPEKTVVRRQGGPQDELLIASFIERLKEGNTRFVTGKRSAQNFAKQRKGLAAGQHPYAVILGCTDSRVPPELVFDESLGQLFTVRDAGNVSDSVTIAGIEDAVQRFNIKLIVILGHTSCGALQPTPDESGTVADGNVLAKRVSSAAVKWKAGTLGVSETGLGASVQNVRKQMKACLEQSAVIRDRIDSKVLKIVGAIYDLETGKVEFL